MIHLEKFKFEAFQFCPHCGIPKSSLYEDIQETSDETVAYGIRCSNCGLFLTTGLLGFEHTYLNR